MVVIASPAADHRLKTFEVVMFIQTRFIGSNSLCRVQRPSSRSGKYLWVHTRLEIFSCLPLTLGIVALPSKMKCSCDWISYSYIRHCFKDDKEGHQVEI
jgi:hypothetical protein